MRIQSKFDWTKSNIIFELNSVRIGINLDMIGSHITFNICIIFFLFLFLLIYKCNVKHIFNIKYYFISDISIYSSRTCIEKKQYKVTQEEKEWTVIVRQDRKEKKIWPTTFHALILNTYWRQTEWLYLLEKSRCALGYYHFSKFEN